MKKAIHVLCFLIAAGILLNGIIMIANDRMAQSLEARLLSAPLPPDTELIERLYYAGRNDLASGNGMQYFGIILVKSTLTAEELQKEYEKLIMQPGYEYVTVERQLIPEIKGLGGKQFRSFAGEGNEYRVELWLNISVGTERNLWEAILNLDLRGH